MNLVPLAVLQAEEPEHELQDEHAPAEEGAGEKESSHGLECG